MNRISDAAKPLIDEANGRLVLTNASLVDFYNKYVVPAPEDAVEDVVLSEADSYTAELELVVIKAALASGYEIDNDPLGIVVKSKCAKCGPADIGVNTTLPKAKKTTGRTPSRSYDLQR